MTDLVGAAVREGTSWLAGAQGAKGDFPSYASPLTDLPVWEPDQLNFVTALVSLALEHVDLPEVPAMRSQVAAYLRSEREPAGLWRYWARDAALHDYTPPDADDTACCSLAVGAGDHQANVRLLLANRDPAGRFYTWFLLRPEHRGLRYRLALRNERSASAQSRRTELWADSEASPGDVDVTVNANVIRYLGARRAPAAAIEWVASVIEAGTEVADDHWYRSRTSLYRSVAATGGVARFVGLHGHMIERLTHDLDAGELRNDLELADALRALRLLGAPPDAIERAGNELLQRQGPTGSWERAICYFGGPQESFGWASEALATATAVGALHGLVLTQQ